MSVTVKVLDANKTIETHQLQAGKTVVLNAKNNVNYQLADAQGYGPENILATRDGNDLVITFENKDLPAALTKDSANEPALIIKDYYAQDGASNLLVGLHENGNLYAYIPESAQEVDAITALAQEMIRPQVLGGSVLPAAVWAFNPWWLAGGLLAAGLVVGVAAAAGGSKKSTPVAGTPELTLGLDGAVVAKPASDNNKMTVAYTDEKGNPQSVTVAKQTDGTWAAVDAQGNIIPKADLPKGVSLDETNGTVSLAPNAVKDGTKVSVKGETAGANPSMIEKSPDANTKDSVADEPTIIADKQGNVTATPGADNDEMVVDYIDEKGNPQSIIVKKQPDGTWKPVDKDGNVIPKADLPKGVTVDETDGTVSLDPNATQDGSEVKVTGKSGVKAPTEDKVNSAEIDSVADRPEVTTDGKDGITAKPGKDNDTMSVKYTDENGDKQTVTVKKQPDGTWKAVDKDGKVIDQLPKGVDVNEKDGTVSLKPNSVKDGEDVNVTGSSAGKGDTTETVTAPEDTHVTDEPKVAVDGKTGVTATPGADNDEMVVSYDDEDGNPKTVTVKKDPATGTWKPVDEKGNEIPAKDLPKGVNVDPKTGTVSIDPNGLADPVDGEDAPKVTVTGKSDDENKADTSVEKEIPADEIADKPTVIADGKDGITAKPGTDNNEMTVSYNDEDGKPQTVTVRKDPATGTWKPVDEKGNEIPAKDLPKGVEVDPETGTVSIDPNATKDGEEVTVTGKSDDDTKSPTEAKVTPPEDKVADEPTVTADSKTGVTAKPGTDNDEMTVEYKDEDGNPKTVTVKKDPATGTWKPVDEKGNEIPAGDLPKGVEVDPKNGTVTIDPNGLEDPIDGEEDAPKVTVTGKSDDKTKEDTSVEKEIPADTIADKPEVEVNETDGKVHITPGKDNVEMPISYTNEDDEPVNLVMKKQDDGTWSVFDENGKELDDDKLAEMGIKVHPDGTIDIDFNDIKDGDTVKAVGKADPASGKEPTEAEGKTPAQDTVADKAEITNQKDGGVKVTPKGDNNEVTVTYTDEDGEKQTVTVKKQPDGTWKPVDKDGEPLDEKAQKELEESGVKVDPKNGEISIDPNSIKDGSWVFAESKAEGKNPTEVEEQAPAEDTVADKPKLATTDEGGVTVTPGDDNDAVTVTYIDQETGETVTVELVKNGDDWKVKDDADLPEGAALDAKTGALTLPEKAVKDGQPVTATPASNGKTAEEEQINAPDLPDAPKAQATEDGGATVKPGDDNTEMTVTWTPEDGDEEKSVKMVKQDDDKWKPVDENGEPLSEDAIKAFKEEGVTFNDDGTVTLAPNAVKDGSKVKAEGTDTTKKEPFGRKVETEETSEDNVADKPSIDTSSVDENGKNTGDVKVKPGEDNDEITVTFKDPDGNPKTATFKKGTDGWEPEGDEVDGVTVDPESGEVTIGSNYVKEGEDVTATGKSAGKGDTPVTEKAPADESVPAEPEVTESKVDGDNTVVKGKAEPGAKVTLTDDKGNVIGETVADKNGNFEIKVPLTEKDGEKVGLEGDFKLQAVDGAGNKSEPVDKTIDVVPPKAPTIESQNGQNGKEIKLKGEKGTKVEIRDPNDPEKVLGEATFDENGDATIVTDEPLKGTFDVVSIDKAGNESKPTELDKEAPAKPTIKSQDGNTIEVEGEEGATIEIRDPKTGEVLGTGVVENGVATITPTNPEKPFDGTYSVVAKDEAGNVSEPTELDKEAPYLAVKGAKIQGDETIIKGTVSKDANGNTPEPGSTVTIKDKAGNTLGTAKVQEDGSYELKVPTEKLTDGEKYDITVTDEKGNVSEPKEFEAKNIYPPIVDSVTNNADSGKTTISGEGEPGTTITVTDEKGNVLGTTEVKPDGTYNVEVDTLPDNGNYKVNASEGEPGTENYRESDDSPAKGDTDKPDAPSIDSIKNDGKGNTTLSGKTEPNATITVKGKDGEEITTTADENGNYTITVPTQDDGKEYEVTATDDHGNVSEPAKEKSDTKVPDEPVVNKEESNGNTVKGTAEPNSIVTVYNDKGEPIGSAQADAEGNFEITTSEPLNGMYGVTATDKQGNESTPAELDKTAPQAPTDVEAAKTDEGNTQVKGKGEPGSVVSLKDAEGNEIGTATVDDKGEFTIDVEGGIEGDFTVDATNPKNGQTSDKAPVEIDTKAPSAPQLTANEDGSVTLGLPEDANEGDKVTVTMTPEGSDTPVDVEMTKQADGSWTSSNEDLIPNATGNTATIPENKVADKSTVSATASDAANNSNDADAVEAQAPKGIAKIYDENGNLVETVNTENFAKYDASWQRYHKEEQWYTDWNKTVNNSGGGVINLNESETRENSQSARGTEWKADHPKALDSDGSWGTTVTSVSPEYISQAASNRIFFKGDKYDAVNLGRDKGKDWGAGSVLSDGNAPSYYDSYAKSTWAKTGAKAEMDGYTYDQWSITSNKGITTSVWIEETMPVL